jgi:hypothetical protein
VTGFGEQGMTRDESGNGDGAYLPDGVLLSRHRLRVNSYGPQEERRGFASSGTCKGANSLGDGGPRAENRLPGSL